MDRLLNAAATVSAIASVMALAACSSGSDFSTAATRVVDEAAFCANALDLPSNSAADKGQIEVMAEVAPSDISSTVRDMVKQSPADGKSMSSSQKHRWDDDERQLAGWVKQHCD